MAIARKTQLQFGGSSGPQQVGVFGSLAAASPAYSTDPAVIQSLSNFLTGWYAAVVGINSPAIQDMNALCYLFAYQFTSLFQDGISQWDSATTYTTGSWVSVAGIPYVSTINSNLNHNPSTDTTNWNTPTFQGIYTPNTIPNTMSLPSGQVLSWPTPTIGSGVTVTIPSGARMSCEGGITVNTGGSLTITGTGIFRSF